MLAWLATQLGELASCQNLSVRLHGQANHQTVCPRIEGGVRATARVESRNKAARLPGQRTKCPSQQNLTVHLQSQGCHRPIWPRVKSEIHAAISV